MGDCLVCAAETKIEGKYCVLHQAALQNMHDSYLIWSKSYGSSLSVEEFLSKLVKLQETGSSVKEVAIFLASNPERWRD